MADLEVGELIEVIYRSLANCKLIDVALFISHRSLGKDLQLLSEQTGIEPGDIEVRVAYVEEQLQHEITSYQHPELPTEGGPNE